MPPETIDTITPTPNPMERVIRKLEFEIKMIREGKLLWNDSETMNYIKGVERAIELIKDQHTDYHPQPKH